MLEKGWDTNIFHLVIATQDTCPGLLKKQCNREICAFNYSRWKFVILLVQLWLQIFVFASAHFFLMCCQMTSRKYWRVPWMAINITLYLLAAFITRRITRALTGASTRLRLTWVWVIFIMAWALIKQKLVHDKNITTWFNSNLADWTWKNVFPSNLYLL